MYIDNFHYDICESNIKHYKKVARCQFGVFLFNLICFSIYLYFIICSDKRLDGAFGMGLGAFFISLFWSLLFTLETFGDLSGEKAQLRHFKKLRNEHHFHETIESLNKTKEAYERLLAGLMKSSAKTGAVGSPNTCDVILTVEGAGGIGGASVEETGSKTRCGHKGHS